MTQKAVKRLPTSAASDNAAVVQAVRTYLYRVMCYNGNAAVRYLKLYNKATTPLSTDTPELIIPLAPASRFNEAIEHRFPLGLGYRLVTGAADSDATAVGTDITGLNFIYA
jgi:hypothetical protein